MITANLTKYDVRRNTLSATTLAEIEDAKQTLRAWLIAHPEDENMRDSFEQLYMMEEAALLTLEAQGQEREKAA